MTRPALRERLRLMLAEAPDLCLDPPCRETACTSPHVPDYSAMADAALALLATLAEEYVAALQAREWEREGQRASEADVLNQELREQSAGVEVEPEQDWRPAIRALVDAAKRSERFQSQARERELVEALKEARSMARDQNAFDNRFAALARSRPEPTCPHCCYPDRACPDHTPRPETAGEQAGESCLECGNPVEHEAANNVYCLACLRRATPPAE